MGIVQQLRRDGPSRVSVSARPQIHMSVRDQMYSSKHDGELRIPTSFCGECVYDALGVYLGEVEELVFDIHSGRVAYALVAVGGVMGAARKLFAIPWSKVTVDAEYQRCAVDTDIDRLKGAPSLDGDLLSGLTDFGWAVDVHAYFGCKPYWE